MPKNWLNPNLDTDDTLEARFCFERVKSSPNSLTFSSKITNFKWQIKTDDGIGSSVWEDAVEGINCYKLNKITTTTYDVTKSYGPVLYTPPIFRNFNNSPDQDNGGGEKIALIPTALSQLLWSCWQNGPSADNKSTIILSNFTDPTKIIPNSTTGELFASYNGNYSLDKVNTVSFQDNTMYCIYVTITIPPELKDYNTSTSTSISNKLFPIYPPNPPGQYAIVKDFDNTPNGISNMTYPTGRKYSVF
jgi:hypothetical protein